MGNLGARGSWCTVSLSEPQRCGSRVRNVREGRWERRYGSSFIERAGMDRYADAPSCFQRESPEYRRQKIANPGRGCTYTTRFECRASICASHTFRLETNSTPIGSCFTLSAIMHPVRLWVLFLSAPQDSLALLFFSRYALYFYSPLYDNTKVFSSQTLHFSHLHLIGTA